MDTFSLHHTWTGTTAGDTVTKAGIAMASGKPTLRLSSGAGDGMDPTQWNPEDLFGASMAQCHTLTFLSLATKIRADVVRVETEVTVHMEVEGKITRIGRITLAPTITIQPGVDPDKVASMYHKAHKYCFIANSTTASVDLDPTIVVQG